MAVLVAPLQVVSISDALSKGVSHTLDLRIHADPYCESDKVSHFMCAAHSLFLGHPAKALSVCTRRGGMHASLC